MNFYLLKNIKIFLTFYNIFAQIHQLGNVDKIKQCIGDQVF